MNKYKEFFQEKREFKGYTDLCKHLGETAIQSRGNQYKAHLDEWARHFETEPIEGSKKGIRVTLIYEVPLLKPMKNSIYAEDIRAIVLGMLHESEDGCLRLTSKEELVGTGFINNMYKEIENAKPDVKASFIKDAGIRQRTLEYFFENNRNTFRGYFTRAYESLAKANLIYTAIKLYVVKFDNRAKHMYLDKDDEVDKLIRTVSAEHLMKRYKTTDARFIMSNEKLRDEFKSEVVRQANIILEKEKKPKIEFYYEYTFIEAVDKNNIAKACEIVNVDQVVKEVNKRVAENLINQAKVEYSKERNKEYAQEYEDFLRLSVENEEEYDKLNEEHFWKIVFERMDKEKNTKYVKSIEEELMPMALMGTELFPIEVETLVNALILQSAS